MMLKDKVAEIIANHCPVYGEVDLCWACEEKVSNFPEHQSEFIVAEFRNSLGCR